MNIYKGLSETDLDNLHDDLQPYLTMENFLMLLNAVAFYADHETYRGVGIVTHGSEGEFAKDFGSRDLLDKDGGVVDTYDQPGKLAREAITTIFADAFEANK